VKCAYRKCGKEFTPCKKYEAFQRYCSPECRSKENAIIVKENEKKKKKGFLTKAENKKTMDRQFAADVAEARRLGISYGQLEAQRYMEQLKAVGR